MMSLLRRIYIAHICQCVTWQHIGWFTVWPCMNMQQTFENIQRSQNISKVWSFQRLGHFKGLIVSKAWSLNPVGTWVKSIYKQCLANQIWGKKGSNPWPTRSRSWGWGGRPREGCRGQQKKPSEPSSSLKIKSNQQPNFHLRQFVLKPYFDWSSSLEREPLVCSSPVPALHVILKVKQPPAHHGIQARAHLPTKKQTYQRQSFCNLKHTMECLIKWWMEDPANGTPHKILLSPIFWKQTWASSQGYPRSQSWKKAFDNLYHHHLWSVVRS